VFDLDAYLERIGLNGRPSIAQVHRAHLTSIPFENLDPHPQRADARGHEHDAARARGHTGAACHALLAPRLHARRRRAARPHQRRIVEGLAVSRDPPAGTAEVRATSGQAFPNWTISKRVPAGCEDRCVTGGGRPVEWPAVRREKAVRHLMLSEPWE
jgi:hypothetical protein